MSLGHFWKSSIAVHYVNKFFNSFSHTSFFLKDAVKFDGYIQSDIELSSMWFDEEWEAMTQG